MPLVIPPKRGQFFALYPNANSALCRTDGTCYMAHYEEKATADAKAAGEKLYEFTAADEFTQIYPPYGINTTPTYIYEGANIDVIKSVEVNGEAFDLASPNSASLTAATKQAANSAGLALFKITASIAPNDWDIEMSLNEEAVVRVKDENGVWTTLTLVS
jgi:hypothetical protein